MQQILAATNLSAKRNPPQYLCTVKTPAASAANHPRRPRSNDSGHPHPNYAPPLRCGHWRPTSTSWTKTTIGVAAPSHYTPAHHPAQLDCIIRNRNGTRNCCRRIAAARPASNHRPSRIAPNPLIRFARRRNGIANDSPASHGGERRKPMKYEKGGRGIVTNFHSRFKTFQRNMIFHVLNFCV